MNTNRMSTLGCNPQISFEIQIWFVLQVLGPDVAYKWKIQTPLPFFYEVQIVLKGLCKEKIAKLCLSFSSFPPPPREIAS